MNEVIYIPIAVEKELPPHKLDVLFFGESYGGFYGCILENEGDWVFDVSDNCRPIAYFTHWLKEIKTEDLILHVQNSIAPQRQDLHTAIEISINEFFK